jgi:hypothetical protein
LQNKKSTGSSNSQRSETDTFHHTHKKPTNRQARTKITKQAIEAVESIKKPAAAAHSSSNHVQHNPVSD